jgi:hypothetical protein
MGELLGTYDARREAQRERAHVRVDPVRVAVHVVAQHVLVQPAVEGRPVHEVVAQHAAPAWPSVRSLCQRRRSGSSSWTDGVGAFVWDKSQLLLG